MAFWEKICQVNLCFSRIKQTVLIAQIWFWSFSNAGFYVIVLCFNCNYNSILIQWKMLTGWHKRQRDRQQRGGGWGRNCDSTPATTISWVHTKANKLIIMRTMFALLKLYTKLMLYVLEQCITRGENVMIIKFVIGWWYMPDLSHIL